MKYDVYWEVWQWVFEAQDGSDRGGFDEWRDAFNEAFRCANEGITNA